MPNPFLHHQNNSKQCWVFLKPGARLRSFLNKKSQLKVDYQKSKSALIEERVSSQGEQNFVRADEIRDELAAFSR
ncbi:MAG: hypothetical protein H7A33_06740 [Deltaproteobacteria bacterium]|nr:hypothetical protein [Deltaproteobacteria bacterium]